VLPVLRPAVGDPHPLRSRLRARPRRAFPQDLPLRLLVGRARARGAATRSGL